MRYIDTFEFVKHAKEFGANEQFAAYEAKEIEHAIKVAVKQLKDEENSKDLATKKDLELTRLALQKDIETVRLELQKDIETVRLELQKEIALIRLDVQRVKIQTLVWIGMNTAFILGIMGRGFHWW